MGSYDFGELAKAAPKGFEPVPAGTYTVECTDAEAKEFSTGSKGVQIEVTIEDPGPSKGRKIKFVNIVFKGDNPGTFFGQLRAFGLGAEFFSEFGTIDENDLGGIMEEVAEEILGKRAVAPVTQRTYEGKVNNSVGFFKPVGEGSKRRSRTSTPNIGDADPTEAEATPKRDRAGRRRGAQPGLPPGLDD